MPDDVSPSARPRLEIVDGKIVYEPDGAVLAEYLADRSPVNVIRGPIGSGTSSASCMLIYSHAMEQREFAGKRRSKWIVVRNTYAELRDTTVATWLSWFPEDQYGKFYWSRPMYHEVRVGNIELDVYFLALDDPADVAKMRSLEVTGFWFNELEFTIKPLFDEAISRCRFPSEKDGGSQWLGVIGDMNAPPEDHWLVQMTGDAPMPDELPEADRASMLWPSTWGYHVQAAAVLEVRSPDGKRVVGYRVNPNAENMKWLPPGYYDKMIAGKPRQWIRARLMNKITFITDGDPVWPMFNEEFHVAAAPLLPVKGYKVSVGLDFGRTRPAAVFMQEIGGTIQVQYELRAYGVGAVTFAPLVKKFLATNYPGFDFELWGDPKGQDKGQATDTSAYDVFENNGLRVRPAPVVGNSIRIRLETVEFVLSDMTGGHPRFLLSPSGCPTLKAAMMGKYVIKKDQNGDPEPVKDKFSDVADALGYDLLGIGEGRAATGRNAAAAGSGRSRVSQGRKSMRLGGA